MGTPLGRKMVVLVCGGREFGDWELLDMLQVNHGGIDVLIHGGAMGADRMSGAWAAERGIRTRVFLADWDRYGRIAGSVRNQSMLDTGRPGLVLVFAGGRGTRI